MRIPSELLWTLYKAAGEAYTRMANTHPEFNLNALDQALNEVEHHYSHYLDEDMNPKDTFMDALKAVHRRPVNETTR